jgi:cobalt transporter subunit CbtB
MIALPALVQKLGLRGRVAKRSSATLAPLCAALLGMALVYGTGFAQTEEIHNGAHDTRHASGFPCH